MTDDLVDREPKPSTQPAPSAPDDEQPEPANDLVVERPAPEDDASTSPQEDPA